MNYLNEIALTNFRNSDIRHVKFDKLITNIYSHNGSGKTSILEAIFLLTSSNSFHKIHNKHLIKYNETDMSICYKIQKNFTTYNVKSIFQNTNQSVSRKIYIDDKKTNLISSASLIKITYFIPQMFTFFTHFPEQRRNFIDRLSFLKLNKTPNKATNFINLIKKFNKLMVERQGLLINNFSHSALEHIEAEMCDIFTYIMEIRINTIIQLQKTLNELEKQELPGLSIKLNIKIPEKYKSNTSNISKTSAHSSHSSHSSHSTNFNNSEILNNPAINYKNLSNEELNNLSSEDLRQYIKSNIFKNQILHSLTKSRYNDRVSKSSAINLNIFDLITTNKKNKLNIKYCSTGEQKMALMTILIAQKGEILLLDEIASFLDKENYAKIWKILIKQKCQIISTSTHPLQIENVNNIYL